MPHLPLLPLLPTMAPGPRPDEGAAHAEHEALCRRCGVSCHFAVPVNGLAVVVDELRCRFLQRDEDGLARCAVYEDRYRRAPWCHSAEEALGAGLLAQDCPYARDVPGYRGKVRLRPQLLALILPAIREELLRVGLHIGADPDAALGLLQGDGGRYAYEVRADGQGYVFRRLAT